MIDATKELKVFDTYLENLMHKGYALQMGRPTLSFTPATEHCRKIDGQLCTTTTCLYTDKPVNREHTMHKILVTAPRNSINDVSRLEDIDK